MSCVTKRVMQATIALAIIASAILYIRTSQNVLTVYSGSTNNPQYVGRMAKANGTGGNWGTFQVDLGRSGFNNFETILNPDSAPTLKLEWSLQARGSISSQPVESNGLIYWGSWDGREHATGLNGKDVWSTYLGKAQTMHCQPPDAGVAGAATVASVLIKGTMTSVVFIGGGTAHFYALDAKSGAILWNISLGSSPNHMLWAGSAVYNGNVYVGVSSYGDCPLVQGSLVKLDASTGTMQNIFNVVPNGCIGGGIWSYPTIDVAANMVYVSTGTTNQCSPPETMSQALIALKATDLSVAGFWQLPANQQVPDADFGSTPTLFQATIGGKVHQIIGLVNKNGYYYALDRSNITGGPLWTAHLTMWQPYQGKYSISSSAWDGTTLYAGGAQTTINGRSCLGSIRALNPATGAFLWETCLGGHEIGAVAVVPGVVVVGAGTSIIVVSAATGIVLFRFQDTNANSLFWGPPSISNGVLYEGNNDGILYAFKPTNMPTPTPTYTPTPTQ